MNKKELEIIKNTFHIDNTDITFVSYLKKGMTNKSFIFKIKSQKYIMRVPGKGTNLIINRANEAYVYKIIKNKKNCENVIYINPNNGFKITEFIENSRCCNPNSNEDLNKCINALKCFHNLNLKVKHEFDVFEQIDFYEKLLANKKSKYFDYDEIKRNVLLLKSYIDRNVQNKCLTHIDAIPDNFLIYKNKDNEEIVKLIDFEYASMQDPHIDIAMFCIYSLYNKKQIDNIINIYFNNNCPMNIRIKIYCYIAVCGLLWSNWCEYKESLGIKFGKYSIAQYNYAKEYSKLAIEMIGDNYE